MPALWEMLTPDQRRVLLERFGLPAAYDVRGKPEMPVMEDEEQIDRIMRQPPRAGKQ